MRATCGGCDATWSGGDRAGHCGRCHETFLGVETFDRHQRWDGDRLVCLRPAEVRRRDGSPAFDATEDGHWRTWLAPEVREANRARLREHAAAQAAARAEVP